LVSAKSFYIYLDVRVEACVGCLAFQRESVLVVVNFGPESTVMPEGEILLASSRLVEDRLPPDTTAWLGV
jgi:alpha-glucosidase